MALEQEMATYERERALLLAHEGRFVVIRGSEVLGTYDTYEDALRDGYRRVGLAPFLVKQIEAVETVHAIAVGGDPCLT